MPCSRPIIETVLASAAAALLGACSSIPSAMPPHDTAAATIAVVERGWHTDVCVRNEDAGGWVADLAHRYDGARYLCFGFGERRYLVTRDPGLIEMITALFPSEAALLMTVLKARPEAAFGPGNVVELDISRAGLAGLQAFLRDAVQTDRAGQPERLGEGPYPGSVYYAATGRYDLRYTCNAWTADALRSAGVPVDDAVVFAGGVMRQVRQLAAEQSDRER